MMACRATQLLSKLIRAEDLGVKHAEICNQCREGTLCATAVDLAMDSIEALLSAKVFLDMREPCKLLL
jgi:hypothetical protein